MLLLLSAVLGPSETLFHHGESATEPAYHAPISVTAFTQSAEHFHDHQNGEGAVDHDSRGEHHDVVRNPLFFQLAGSAVNAFALLFASAVLVYAMVRIATAEYACDGYLPRAGTHWSSVTPSRPPVARLLRTNHALLN